MELFHPDSATPMSIIYRKTSKGVTEIETRVNRLAPRARSALILVDGKRDVLALKSLVSQQADELLAMLFEQGFIEGAGESTTAPSVPAMPLGSPVARPGSAAPAPAAPMPAGSPPAIDFVARRRAAVRELNDALGPAGETLAIKMERVRDADELRSLIQMAAQVIVNARGRAAAEAYAARHAI